MQPHFREAENNGSPGRQYFGQRSSDKDKGSQYSFNTGKTELMMPGEECDSVPNVHKRLCPYKDCTCNGCNRISERQLTMAPQEGNVSVST